MCFPFDDHSPPPFELMRPCVSHMSSFLEEDEDNVVALHCKAGKGRTGVMSVAYLLQSGQCKTAQEAMDFFAKARTHDGKGVTIPSQRRYCQYFAENLGKTRRLKAVRILTVSVTNCTQSSFVNPSLIVAAGQDIIKVSEAIYDAVTETLIFHVDFNFIGDIKITMQDDKAGPFYKDSKAFWCWIHSSFVTGTLVLSKSELDGPMKKDMKKHERFDAGLKVTINVAGCRDASRLVDAPGSGITGAIACGRATRMCEETELLSIESSVVALMEESSMGSSLEDQVVATTRNRCMHGHNSPAFESATPTMGAQIGLSGSEGSGMDRGRFERLSDGDGFAFSLAAEGSSEGGCVQPLTNPAFEGPAGARESMKKLWTSSSSKGSMLAGPRGNHGSTDGMQARSNGVVLYDFEPQGDLGTLFQDDKAVYKQIP